MVAVVVEWAFVAGGLFLGLLLVWDWVPVVSGHREAVAEARRLLAKEEGEAASGPAAPAATAATARRRVVPWSRVWRECLARARWKLLAVNLLSVCALKALLSYKPRLTAWLVDLVTRGGDPAPPPPHHCFGDFARWAVGLALLELALMTLRDWSSYGLTHRFTRDAKVDLARRVLSQDQRYLQALVSERGAASLSGMVAAEVERVGSLTNGSLATVAGSVAEIGLALPVAVAAGPWLCALALALKLPLLAALEAVAARQVRVYHLLYDRALRRADDVFHRCLSSPRSVMTVQSAVAVEAVVARLRGALDDFIRALDATHLRETAMCWGGFAVATAEDVALTVAGLYLVLGTARSESPFTLGDYMVFRALVGQVGAGVKSLVAWGAQARAARETSWLFFELLDRAPEVARGVGERAEAVTRVEARGVRFGYGPAGSGPPVLRGVDLSLSFSEAAPWTVLAGRSGCGKSTLLALLTRFHAASGGAIEVNGRPIAEWEPDWLRSQVCLVEQGAGEALFDGLSIEDNILLGRRGESGGSREALESAARAAQAHAFIEGLDAGYSTLVGARPLSGGQRTRIALARALAASPAVLLLDEAFANLDRETETAVARGVETWARRARCALVLVSHHHSDEHLDSTLGRGRWRRVLLKE
jgi:ABC-type multidrug transport system fused ATPase/permease subunit